MTIQYVLITTTW